MNVIIQWFSQRLKIDLDFIFQALLTAELNLVQRYSFCCACRKTADSSQFAIIAEFNLAQAHLGQGGKGPLTSIDYKTAFGKPVIDMHTVQNII